MSAQPIPSVLQFVVWQAPHVNSLTAQKLCLSHDWPIYSKRPASKRYMFWEITGCLPEEPSIHSAVWVPTLHAVEAIEKARIPPDVP